MATSFFGGAFFGGEFFSQSSDVAVKTGTGGIDPVRRIVKPTGLLQRKKATPTVAERVDESREIAAEIAGKLAREFSEENEALLDAQPIESMSLRDIEREIGILLRKKVRNEEDELILLLLLAASA